MNATGSRPDQPNGTVLTADELSLLRSVQDRLVPGDGQMPPAHATGAAIAVDTYLAERTELRAPILGVLRAISIATAVHDPAHAGFAHLDGDVQDEILHKVEASEPEWFDCLLVQTYTGYYTDPTVQAVIGVPSPLQPAGYASMMQPTFDERRLDRVRATARPWREA
ncbi:MAG: gluconate 2-dehydrogenase subunit 3 family protein [Proteobacteria bacterium]|jgi:hypothetical protein|nr:gluconate 2-dehydrogenase subunit 3 family protein [Pseudomonadota bacterium]NCV21779.1 gluconate 2-dehydrogenase subunit 3 family protein [Chloroflexota bacterium]NBQ31628.1 gluconate 2-dehydrogenase subunit 3 family protein [Pseudomonadota bacterium]NBQ63587.1 gluconate 2-dehydrogenase subunit 3 family protein [Pseudomonadota bacterium]NBT04471.1 gluconate 2-dehydrogenase subunit 3 family protein [Pseudomonadota bacterium]